MIDYKLLKEVLGLLDQHDPHWYKRIDVDVYKPGGANWWTHPYFQLYGNKGVALRAIRRKYGKLITDKMFFKLQGPDYHPFWTDAILIRLHPDRDLSPAACKQSIVELIPEQLSQPVIEETAWFGIDPMYEPLLTAAEELTIKDFEQLIPGWEAPGTKYDDGKIRTDLMRPEALLGLAEVLTCGAKKYGDRNWENGIDYSRVYAAALRHLLTWFKGEDNDDETGMSHLDHAACCIHFLQTYVKNEKKYASYDDRPVITL